ncbi:hypothetical protein MCHI_001879 [Candidatus Magnetoovum chiemensis]|nr:hypothetical protein MCHI_001879 [Candidatus Magnetoovum chiemensis]
MDRKLLTTGIGSLPHKDKRLACKLILEYFDIPFWPQLPSLSFKEAMVSQYSEGMPFIQINAEKEKIWIQRDGQEDLNRFYEQISKSPALPISNDYACGFYEMAEQIKNRHFSFLKGQITGPLTFTLGLKDKNGAAIYFDEELREVALMLLEAKAVWQAEALKQFCDNVIIFIDEPILTALGSSAYLGVSADESFRALFEIIEKLKNKGAITAIHCCGKTDWDMIFNLNPDIVNFDAYSYFDSLEIYHERITQHLNRGGTLAWGIVPTTSKEINKESVESLINNFMNKFNRLSKKIDYKLLLSQTMLTPSCGTGSLSIDEALKCFDLLKKLKEHFLLISL